MASAGGVIKRILLGRQVASSRLEHTLLPKFLALPVFSSDALSSVAYATEEILHVIVPISLVSAGLAFPLAIAISLLMVVVITSYRQTVRAYPRGGGAYIVSKENLGRGAALVAAGALLTDYVLTVAVSVAAGVFAIVSALPTLDHLRVPMAVGFILFITLMNLRGLRESGTLFALPTYGFVITMYVMIGAGLLNCLDGCPRAVADDPIPQGAAVGLGLLFLLRAFSSGATALTGIEAIADGVLAFRRPRAKNAAATLGMMGVISISMFLGISYLAVHTGAVPSEHQSVVSQIAEAIFGGGWFFYAVQAATAAILILAANTAYQDFPRLLSILARDRYVPRQFENMGDRLVFSNGIVVLAGLAAMLVWIFDADVTRLIQLYVVGVFTAFTLSQTGMVRRWLKLRTPGWRRSMTINAIGAVVTGVVLVVVAVTKFRHGAWIVIVAVPIIVLILHGIHRHYAAVHEQLHQGTVRFGETGVNHVVIVLTDVDAASAEALGYVRSFTPREVRAIYVGSRPQAEVRALWGALSRGMQVEFPPGRDRVDAALDYIRDLPRSPGDFVTAVIPERFERRSLIHATLRRWTTFRLKVRLLSLPQVVVTDVPVLVREGRAVGVDAMPFAPERVGVLVFVSSLHDASIRALNYARSLRAAETWAVCIALDPQDVQGLPEAWAAAGIDIPLEIVDAPFRDMGAPLLEEVRRVTGDPQSLAAVIVPEFVVRRWWHHLLHNQRALFVKRMLLFEERVVLSSVPFPLR